MCLTPFDVSYKHCGQSILRVITIQSSKPNRGEGTFTECPETHVSMHINLSVKPTWPKHSMNMSLM